MALETYEPLGRKKHINICMSRFVPTNLCGVLDSRKGNQCKPLKNHYTHLASTTIQVHDIAIGGESHGEIGEL